MGGDAGQGARGDHDDASQCQWREVCVLSRAHTKNVVSSVNAVLVNRNVRKNKSLTLTVNTASCPLVASYVQSVRSRNYSQEGPTCITSRPSAQITGAVGRLSVGCYRARRSGTWRKGLLTSDVQQNERCCNFRIQETTVSLREGRL